MTALPAPPSTTANDRLKASWPSFLWGSLTLATVLHALVFALWPTTTVAVELGSAAELDVVRLPDLEIPPQPEPLSRPAPPVPSTSAPDDVVIAPFEQLWNEAPDVPPPAPAEEDPTVGHGTFTPFTVAPRILNAAEVLRAAEREYPAPLRDAGISGTVILQVLVGEDGEVAGVEVVESSGYASLDRAALRVAPVLRMSPALNRDRRVAVLTRVPITFRVR